MTTIIAGRFELQDDAQRAAAELARAGFPADRISVFYEIGRASCRERV